MMKVSVSHEEIDGAIADVEGATRADMGLDRTPVRPSWSREGDEDIKRRLIRMQSEDAIRAGLISRPGKRTRPQANKHQPISAIVSAVWNVGRRIQLRYFKRFGATKRQA